MEMIKNLIYVVEGIYNSMKQIKIPSIKYCCMNLINFSICNLEKLVCTLNGRKLELCIIIIGVIHDD